MTPVWPRILELLDRDGRCALVTVAAVAGSAPREAGARLVVRADGAFHGSIGGGALEWQALAAARTLIARAPAGETRTQALGPDLGQCCGGRVDLRLEAFTAADRGWIAPLARAEHAGPIATAGRVDAAGRLVRRLAAGPAPAGEVAERFGADATPLVLFGAGHVGRALVLALAPLPFAVRWVDPRPEAFPAHVPANTTAVRSADPPAELATVPDGALVVVMTHSHPLDLALVEAALRAGRFAHVGLIGSATKRARFARRLREAGLDPAPLVCPIGVPGIADKAPAVIAAAVAAELLQVREAGTRLALSPGVAPAAVEPPLV